jgi:O-antigen/teichoic acid export membrane protein
MSSQITPTTPSHPRPGEAERAVQGLFRRDLLYLVLWAAQIGAVALFTPVTTRLLGASRYGQAAVAVALMQVVVAIASFQLQTAVQRAHAREGEDAARALIALAIALALMAFAIANLTGPLWSSVTGQHGFTSTLHYAVTWGCLTAVSNACLGLIRSRDRLGQFALVTIGQSLFAEAVAVGLVLLVSRTASEYVFGQMIAQALAVAVALVLARPALPRQREIPLMTAALRYCAALVPAALAVFVIDASDRLVIQHYLGAVAVARYTVARNIGGVAIVLLVVLNNVWMPRLFSLSSATLRRSVLASSRNASVALLIPAVVGWTVIAPLVVELFARPQKLVGIIAIIAITSFPAAAAVSAIRTILCTTRTRAIAGATVLAALANLGLNFLLVPVLGIEGSALATLAAYVLRWAILAAIATNLIRLPGLPIPFVLGALGSIGAALALTRLPDSGPLIALRVAVGAAALTAFGTLAVSLAAPVRFPWVARVRGSSGLAPAAATPPGEVDSPEAALGRV